MTSIAILEARRLSRLAGAMAAVVGSLYLLISVDLVAVRGVADVEGPAVPLIIAGILFLALAALTMTRPSRAVWVAGAVLQILVIVGYLAVSAERDPAFEPWGLGLKAAQLALLAAFAYLALTRRPSR